jgi:hypothetical protein
MFALPTPETLTGTDRPNSTLLERCLYCAVTERCGGHILPFGVRQMIKEYAFVKFDNATIREAVRLWCGDRAVALQRCGEINDWDVRNDRSMRGMFLRPEHFNQPLDTWDVSQVYDVQHVSWRLVV